jgi:two-component system cell cycle response regulator DivK
MQTIVVVDDDKANNTLITAMLKDYKVVTANSAQEGIDLIRQVNPNLILIDLRMPGMDGIAAIQIIKADPDLAHIPIVVVTANLYGETYERARAVGCDDYLSKPFTPKDLVALVRQYLD